MNLYEFLTTLCDPDLDVNISDSPSVEDAEYHYEGTAGRFLNRLLEEGIHDDEIFNMSMREVINVDALDELVILIADSQTAEKTVNDAIQINAIMLPKLYEVVMKYNNRVTITSSRMYVFATDRDEAVRKAGLDIRKRVPSNIMDPQLVFVDEVKYEDFNNVIIHADSVTSGISHKE